MPDTVTEIIWGLTLFLLIIFTMVAGVVIVMQVVSMLRRYFRRQSGP
jgi:hypothetical protein